MNSTTLVGWIASSDNAKVASSRIRTLEPIAFLQSIGYSVELFDLAHAMQYKIVVFSKRYDHKNILLAQRLQEQGIIIVFDLCDNHFYNPNELPVLTQRANALKQMLTIAHHIVVSTDTLKEVVIQQIGNLKPVTVIGDIFEKKIFSETSNLRRHYNRILFSIYAKRLRKFVEKGYVPIVWFGSHGQKYVDAGMTDLLLIEHDLHAVHQENPIVLTVISNSKSKYNDVIKPLPFDTLYLEWSSDTFLEALAMQSFCVIPITQNEFTVCKTNNRLVTALYNSIPTVATMIPSYKPFKDVALFGNFKENIEYYIHNRSEAAEHVKNAKPLIVKSFSIEIIANAWKSLFDLLLRKKND